MAKAVLAKMGIAEVDGVLTEFGSLIPGLKAGRFDIIAAGMFVNPARCAEIAFSEPSYGIGQAMLVPAGNPKGIVDYATFAENGDLKLAVMAGAVEAGYANDAGVGLGQVVSLPDQASLVAAVQAGRADAAALTALSIADMASKAEGVESTKPFGEVAGKSVKGHGAFGFRKEDRTSSRPSTPSSRPSSARPSTSRWSSPSASAPTTCRTDHRRALRRRVDPRPGRPRRRPVHNRRSAMGLGTLAGMLVAALAADRPARHPPRLRGLPAAAPAGRGADRRDHPARLRCSPSSWACSPRSPGSTARRRSAGSPPPTSRSSAAPPRSSSSSGCSSCCRSSA